MRFVLYTVLLSITLYAKQGEIGTSDNCITCHRQFAEKWHASRHAMSHFSKNDLFKKSLMFITREHPELLLSEMKLKCAKCHNPRVTRSSINTEEKVSLLLQDSKTEEEIHRVLNSRNMKDGINCLVCHNIDQIHLNKVEGSRGADSITFGPRGTIFGPFDSAGSPYHKSVKRDHFIGDDPTLCFACHYGMKNENGVAVYATGTEYDANRKHHGAHAITGCKSCHMSPRKRGAASDYAKGGTSPKSRMIRLHRFASVDNSDILKNHVEVTGRYTQNAYIIGIRNNTPHKLPTGYGLRKITLEVDFYDKEHKLLGSDYHTFGVNWRDAKGDITIPHLAASTFNDTRLAPQTYQEFTFPLLPGSAELRYTFSYKLIGNVMARKLNITDPFFLKRYIIIRKTIPLSSDK